MSCQTEPTVTVPRCPCCAQAHTYSALVQRTGRPEPEPVGKRRYKRFFTCQVTGSQFVATVTEEQAVDE